MGDVDAHQHRYRTPVAAIVGLAESALQREDLDQDLLKQLRAIRLLAQEALAASEHGDPAAEVVRQSDESGDGEDSP
jgi:signal transduction histidine kinase